MRGELATGDVDRLAVHWEGAGDAKRAAGLFREAADRAGAALAFDRAVEFYRRALALGGDEMPGRAVVERLLADALLNDGDALLWGDLVVGKYDTATAQVKWETVDGLPTHTDGTCGPYEPDGWRRGEIEAGDNVGRYTSIQISTKGHPMVSYYDDTNNRLKFAIHDGGWKVSVLKEASGADVGKYSKMLLVEGKPVIAYMHLEPGSAGRTRTKISLARAKRSVASRAWSTTSRSTPAVARPRPPRSTCLRSCARRSRRSAT